ncbi:MAG: ribonuclease HII [Bacteroidetes bacterium]|nr:ribonuclease HII [Bacteroidota bacterium]
MSLLKPLFESRLSLQAGCDEAGRGCLAGPVFAAAVILPKKIPFEISEILNDSKKLSKKNRYLLRLSIEKHALAFSVKMLDNNIIDKINILQASFRAMHMAIRDLSVMPKLLLIDGPYFLPYVGIPHQCIIKGDSKYMPIAAASVLAKTWRDEYMEGIHLQYPQYLWNSNKGYASAKHCEAIAKFGLSPYHRKSFHLKRQLKIEF